MAINIPYSVEMKEDQHAWLERMADKYDLPDSSKAMRVLIEFARAETKYEEEIFQEIRCSSC